MQPPIGVFPRWRHDGRELYYLAPSAAMMGVPVAVTGAGMAPGAPVTLFPTRVVGGGADRGLGREYDVTRDGRFLINTELETATGPATSTGQRRRRCCRTFRCAMRGRK